MEELLVVACQRVRTDRNLQTRLVHWRDRRFDHRLARELQATDHAVVLSAGSGLATVRQARKLDIASFVVAPLAHHQVMTPLLREEARRKPDFAATMQGHDQPERYVRQCEAEFNECDKVIVLSTFQSKTFAAAGVPTEKLAVLHLGVDTTLFAPHRRQEDGKFRVLFVGQLTQRKGLSYLLDAFASVRQPNWELVLAGSAVGRSAPWEGTSQVRQVPHVPRWELPALYASADVYVLPSLAEGFPQTALEAMACGIPVIVSEHTFAEDVVEHGDNGFVVPIRDWTGIAELLAQLAASPSKRAAMGQRARSTALAFSWDAMGERLTALIRQLDS